MIINTPEKIDMYRMHVLHKMLKLEMLGVKMSKCRQPSAYSVIKKEYGLIGSRQKVYDGFEEIIAKIKQYRGF